MNKFKMYDYLSNIIHDYEDYFPQIKENDDDEFKSFSRMKRLKILKETHNIEKLKYIDYGLMKDIKQEIKKLGKEINDEIL